MFVCGDCFAVVNTVFQWTFGANTVELTGTFNNWENPIPLKKMENNCFEIILKLSPGVYQYKYIVDSEWRFSPDDPTCNDENGNINNIIDTTNIQRTMSLIGQNGGSQRFLMSSQNNSVNFIPQNALMLNSNGSNVGTRNMQLSSQQQQIYSQLQQQQQQQHAQQFNAAYQQRTLSQQQHLQQQQQQQFVNFTNTQQNGVNSQKVFQPIQMNPQMAQLSYDLILQQQQQQQFQQILPNNLNQQIQSSSTNSSLQQQQVIPNQLAPNLIQAPGIMLSSPNVFNGINLTPMQQMYFQASQKNSGVFDRTQLMVKAHILQQNQTNFDQAFKEAAPQLPPHLLDVPAMKNRNAQNISIWREKVPHPILPFKSIFQKAEQNHGIETEEIQSGAYGDNNNQQQNTLENTPSDEAEILIHVFQPSHSISPVDHVTLNHVGMDNMKHSEKYNVYCLTQRFRTKYTTYQFYVSKYDTQIIL